MNKRSQPPRISRKWPLKIGLMILIAIWIFLTLDILWPLISDLSNALSDMKLTEPDGANYLVIAPQALVESASAWADYRQSTGYHTQLVLLTPGHAQPEEIRDLIQNTYTDSGKPYPFYVLLIGRGHPFSSHPNAYLPAAHFSVDPVLSPSYGTDPIASDDGYTSFDPDGIPDHLLPIFIGRIPVRTEEEGFLLLERTRAYEETPPTGQGRARIELVISDAGFGPQYDPIFEWMLRILIQKMMPDEFQWHLLSGNSNSPYNYPIHSFPNEVANRLDSGALAMVYIGHGQPDMLCCAYSPYGEAGRIISLEDAELIQNADASLGIFTACSAGTYDLAGDSLSVVESIYLTPGGPVAAYSSSAWINGTLNGRLVVDIFEALLIERASTVGELVSRIESWSDMTSSRALLAAVIKGFIPRMSGVFQKKTLLSPTQARQELDIQHATYNLFGDPALRIAYAQQGMKVSPDWSWQLRKGRLAFHGNSSLPAGHHVSIFLETLPGNAIPQEGSLSGAIDRYLQANDPVIQRTVATVEGDGYFSGRIDIPHGTPDGKYLLRAFTALDDDTLVAAHAVYIGWHPITEIFSSTFFCWSVVGILLLVKSVAYRRSSRRTI